MWCIQSNVYQFWFENLLMFEGRNFIHSATVTSAIEFFNELLGLTMLPCYNASCNVDIEISVWIKRFFSTVHCFFETFFWSWTVLLYPVFLSEYVPSCWNTFAAIATFSELAFSPWYSLQTVFSETLISSATFSWVFLVTYYFSNFWRKRLYTARRWLSVRLLEKMKNMVEKLSWEIV